MPKIYNKKWFDERMHGWGKAKIRPSLDYTNRDFRELEKEAMNRRKAFNKKRKKRR